MFNFLKSLFKKKTAPTRHFNKMYRAGLCGYLWEALPKKFFMYKANRLARVLNEGEFVISNMWVYNQIRTMKRSGMIEEVMISGMKCIKSKD